MLLSPGRVHQGRKAGKRNESRKARVVGTFSFKLQQQYVKRESEGR
jgi:hypothetical protein